MPRMPGESAMMTAREIYSILLDSRYSVIFNAFPALFFLSIFPDYCHRESSRTKSVHSAALLHPYKLPLLWLLPYVYMPVPVAGEYYSYKIDIIPKMKYNVLESEVYSLCI